jgi:hypothetical protein
MLLAKRADVQVFLLLLFCLSGCPGYLEEQAWLGDGGARVNLAIPTVGATGTGGSLPALGAAGGAGGAVAAAAGGAAGSIDQTPAAASGGSTGAAAKPDTATPAPAPTMDAAAAPSVAAACSTAAEITGKILMPKCSKCHNPDKLSGNLDLQTAGARARLVNAMAKCAGKVLVTPGQPVTGHLFDKLAGPVMGCGARMPAGGAPALSDEEITCLKDWITPPGPAMATPPPTPTPVAPIDPCATAPEILAKILMPKCGACHGAKVPTAGLDLISPGAKLRLLNVPSRGCPGKTLVTDSPEVGGHFFDKLAGPVQGCSAQMPLGAPLLLPEEIKCLKLWIKPTP